MAQNQTIFRKSAAADLDPLSLYLQARARRDAYVGHLIVDGLKTLYGAIIGRAVATLAHRRALAQMRSLDAHMLADIGVDPAALDKGIVRRRDAMDDVLKGPAMWPRRPETHSVPLSDVVPGASAANDPLHGGNGAKVA